MYILIMLSGDFIMLINKKHPETNRIARLYLKINKLMCYNMCKLALFFYEVTFCAFRSLLSAPLWSVICHIWSTVFVKLSTDCMVD